MTATGIPPVDLAARVVLDVPLTGVREDGWHAVFEICHLDPIRDRKRIELHRGNRELGVAACGGWVYLQPEPVPFDPDDHRRIDSICPECAWEMAIRSGTTEARIQRLRQRAPGHPASDLAADTAAAILAADGGMELLLTVTRHAPSPLVAFDCADEGGCDHDETGQDCPVAGMACLTCTPMTKPGGDWPSVAYDECLIEAPCQVLVTLAAHYGITTGPDGGAA